MFNWLTESTTRTKCIIHYKWDITDIKWCVIYMCVREKENISRLERQKSTYCFAATSFKPLKSGILYAGLPNVSQ